VEAVKKAADQKVVQPVKKTIEDFNQNVYDKRSKQ
jgi:hypothetical protein